MGDFGNSNIACQAQRYLAHCNLLQSARMNIAVHYPVKKRLLPSQHFSEIWWQCNFSLCKRSCWHTRYHAINKIYCDTLMILMGDNHLTMSPTGTSRIRADPLSYHQILHTHLLFNGATKILILIFKHMKRNMWTLDCNQYSIIIHNLLIILFSRLALKQNKAWKKNMHNTLLFCYITVRYNTISDTTR